LITLTDSTGAMLSAVTGSTQNLTLTLQDSENLVGA
jgi:hypothetical protein